MKAGFWEILLIVILVLILFGHSKIPDLMKNLANGINIFKKELKVSSDKKEETAVGKKTAVNKKALVPVSNKGASVIKTAKEKQVVKKPSKAKAIKK